MGDDAMTDANKLIAGNSLHRSSSIDHRPFLRAAVYELLSRLLSPPDLAHGEQALQISFTLSRTEVVPNHLRESFRKLTDALAQIGLNEIEREWQATFGLTDSGPLSLCETEYGMAHIFQKSHTLADIAGFYRAFGLERAAGAERPDHLSAEFEFLSFLAMKESYALENRKVEPADVSRAAERLFLSEHTGRFAPGLFKKMIEKGGFYGAVAETGLTAVLWIMSEHAIALTDQLNLSSPGAPEEPLSCGAMEGAVPGAAQAAPFDGGCGACPVVQDHG